MARVCALALLLLVRPAFAQQIPPGCSGAGASLGLSVFFANGAGAVGTPISPCETIYLQGSVGYPQNPPGTCAFTGGDLTLTTPDGFRHSVVPTEGLNVGGAPLSPSDPGPILLPRIEYRLTPFDVGTLGATLSYGEPDDPSTWGIAFTGTPPRPAIQGRVIVFLETAPCPPSTPCQPVSCDPNAFAPSGRKGICVQGPPQECPATGECSVSFCGASGCESSPRPDGTACSDVDGDACTAAACRSGACDQQYLHPPSCTFECGDGVIAPGETCDPPGSLQVPVLGGEANRVCREGCGFCGDGVLQGGETCDGGNAADDPCGAENACRASCEHPLCKPAGSIRRKNPASSLRLTGRLEPFGVSLDPAGDELRVTLLDAAGEVGFSAALPAGSLRANASRTRFRYSVPLANAPAPGIAKATISIVRGKARFSILAVGDLSRATAQMKSIVRVGVREFSSDGPWTQLPTGWRLQGRASNPR